MHCRTLPSNLALCVHPDFVYVKAKDPSTGRVYLVAEALLHELPGAVPKESKKKDKSQPKKGGFEVSQNLNGAPVLCLPMRACVHACVCACVCACVPALAVNVLADKAFKSKLAAKQEHLIAQRKSQRVPIGHVQSRTTLLVHELRLAAAGVCLS